jgi:hypothetical protein
MKKILFFIFYLNFILTINAQYSSDLLIYTTNAEKIKVYLKSSLINNYYSNKIFINDLQTGQYNLKIIFENYSNPQIETSIFIPVNTQVVCAVKKGYDTNYFIDIYNNIYYDSELNNQNNNGSGNNQGVFCNYPTDETAFNNALLQISNLSFDSKKLEFAKQISETNCLTTIQIKQIIKQFDFESSKLEYAKFAYKYCFDPNVYFMLNDAFDFSSSVTELNNYIKSIK